MMKKKRSFKGTPNAIQDSMKIIVGNKTNSRVRDFGEEGKDDKNIEEKTGIIVSIDKNKINGNGWTVQCKDGTYKCSCASNLYEIPKSKEKGGILYPKEKVQCKIKINPVLRVNTITEISGSKKKKEKLNISKWTHKDQDTQVIASAKSAISISDGAITFNYNDKTKVTIDEKGVQIQGQVNTDALNVEDKALQDYIPDTSTDTQKMTTDGNDDIDTNANDSTAEISIKNSNFILSSKERVIGNILDQTKTPSNDQKVPMFTDENIDELNIYNNGIITVRGRIKSGKRTINHTEKWVPQKEKNIFSTTISGTCDYCEIYNSGEMIFLDYCPSCKKWNVLSKNKEKIVCNSCMTTYCHNCGHNETNTDGNLWPYESNYLEVTTTACQYCDNILPTDKTKQYANYCPNCKTFQTLNVIDFETNTGPTNKIECSSCKTTYCTNCGTQQEEYKQQKFNDNIVYYDDYIKKMNKLRFIKENQNG